MGQGYLYIWTRQDLRTYWYPVAAINAMQEKAIELSTTGRDVYFGVGISGKHKPKGRSSNDDIIAIPGVWMDLDLKDSAAHKEQNLPTSYDEIKDKIPIEPSIVVHSGHGVHLYWLFREVWVFDSPDEKKRAEELLKGFQTYVRQRLGYQLDSTHDLARVLRLPGTINYKSNPAPVQIIEGNGIRYNIDDIEQFKVEVNRAVASPVKVKRGGFERRESDGSAKNLLECCSFIRYCVDQAAQLPEPWWVAMLSNIARCSDGEQAAHELSAPYPKYSPEETSKKIEHVLGDMGPQTCEYIKKSLGFKDCPSDCDVKAPCCWALEEMPRAVAKVRMIKYPAPEIVFTPETLGVLAVLQEKNTVEFSKFKARCKGSVNTFDLLKAIKEQRRKRHNLKVIDGGAGTGFDGAGIRKTIMFVRDSPLVLRLPDGFEYSIEGVQEVKEDSLTGAPIYHTAAWTPVIISAHITNIDMQSEKLELAFKVRGTWKKTICKRSDTFIARNLALLSDAGLGVSSETARYLVKYLQALEAENVTEIPRLKAVSKLGWRDSETVFILPGIESSYIIDLEGGMESIVSGFKQSGDFEEWIETMKKVRSRNKARLIFAASFAAPILKVVGQRSFAIHNWDNSRGGKTATQHAALSVWGKPGEIARTFDDTRTSLERTASLYTDLPLGINEYELLNNKKKENIDSMIYQICEGQGRGRGTINGLQNTVRWRTVAITNGESQIIQDSSKGGVFTRLIEIKGGPLVDDDMFASSLYAFTARNHGHAGKLFIEKLLKSDHGEICVRYEKVREIFRKNYPGNIPSHLDIMACLAIADYYSSVWVFGDSSQSARETAIRITQEAIAELPSAAEADESVRAWEWLPDWIAANSKRFESFPFEATEVYGCKDGDYIFIIKSKLCEALKKEGFNANKVLRSWADQGLFPCGNNGKKTRELGIKSKVINGVQPRVIKILKDTKFE